MPFIWFQRWVNPNFYDQMMQACARGGLKTPRIVQEAPDRDNAVGPCAVPDWNRMAQRVHALALPARCRVASSRGYECRTRIQPDLEEGQLVALLLQKFVAQVGAAKIQPK